MGSRAEWVGRFQDRHFHAPSVNSLVSGLTLTIIGAGYLLSAVLFPVHAVGDTGLSLLNVPAASVAPTSASPAPSPDAPGPRENGRLSRAIEKALGSLPGAGDPGYSVGILVDGKFVYRKSFGAARLGSSQGTSSRVTPNTPGTTFNIGSSSKSFTAFAVALLADKRRLDLDAEISNYLPEFKKARGITVRQLVHHTAGLYTNYLATTTRGEVAACIDRLGRLGLRGIQAYSPGQHRYSNGGYVLLGEIVARVSGQPFPRFVQENIFAPLGMTRSFFYDSHDKARTTGMAFGYSGRTYAPPGTLHVGQGNIVTDLDDLSRWLTNYMDNKLGSGAKLMREVLARGVPARSGVTYGFGLEHGKVAGRDCFWHAGAKGGYLSCFLVCPKDRAAVILMANRDGLQIESMCKRLFRAAVEARTVVHTDS